MSVSPCSAAHNTHRSAFRHLAVVRGAVLYGLHFANGPTWHCTRTYGVAVADMPTFEPLWILKKVWRGVISYRQINLTHDPIQGRVV